VSSPTDPDLSALSPLASALASTIARVASDIALVVDQDGVISCVAEGATVQAHGCSQWVGQRWVDTVSAGTRTKIQSLMQEVASQGVVSRRREVSHPGQGGEEMPVAWSALRLGVDGPVLAVGRDLRAVAAIQQRFVEAQQDMERHYWNRRQAENRYQLLFQVANDAVLVVDANTQQVLQANAAAADLLGLALPSIQGRRLTDSLPVAARPAVAELLSTARSTGQAGAIRVRALAVPGAVDISATPVHPGGQQHLLIRARRDSPDNGAGAGAGVVLSRMPEYVETTPAGLVITDSFGCILMANPAFVRLMRETDEARVRGRALTELLHDADGTWAGMVDRVREAGMVCQVPLALNCLDGTAQDVQVTAALMPEGEQACLGFVLQPQHRLPAHLAGHDLLSGLLDQVGRVPLADLLVEVTQRAERQLIENALLRTGGQRATAADALGLSPAALELRIQRHGLGGLRYPADAAGAPPWIN